jgi:hypothetical protein
MHPAKAARGKVFLAGLLAAFLLGCGDDDRGLGGLTGNETLPGTSRSVPQIAGDWAYEATAEADTCGGAGFLFDERGKLTVALSDTAVTFAISGACDNALAEGDGTALHDGTVTLQYKRALAVSERCLLTLTAEIDGTVNDLRTGIAGTHVLAVSAEGECGGGFPCAISGAFTAARCPAGGCEPLVCEVPDAG